MMHALLDAMRVGEFHLFAELHLSPVYHMFFACRDFVLFRALHR